MGDAEVVAAAEALGLGRIVGPLRTSVLQSPDDPQAPGSPGSHPGRHAAGMPARDERPVLRRRSGYDDPRRRALETGATDWRLLLQIDSDDVLGSMWGDSGRVYFWIREQDV